VLGFFYPYKGIRNASSLTIATPPKPILKSKKPLSVKCERDVSSAIVTLDSLFSLLELIGLDGRLI